VQGDLEGTGFTSLTGFGTSRRGDEGGVLSIVVTHYYTTMTMTMTMTNIPMAVTSTVHAPARSTYAEGTTVADFSQPTGGAVEIEPGQAWPHLARQ